MADRTFTIDANLSRLLLQAQGDPAVALGLLPDSVFAATGKEAAERMVAAVADIAYRALHDRQQSAEHDDDQIAGPRLPLARFAGFRCEWMDPRLAGLLAKEFGLHENRQGSLLGALLMQYFSHALSHAAQLSGDFGQVVADSATGLLAVDLSQAKPAQLQHFPARDA